MRTSDESDSNNPERPASKIAILLMAHGSRRAEANQELIDLAQRLLDDRERHIVEPSFLELAEPGIVEAGETCVRKGAEVVLMIPYFLSAGVHIRRDLADAQATLAIQFPRVDFRLAPPLGPHRLLDELVRERIRDLGETD